MTRGIAGLILAGGTGRRLGGLDKGLVLLADRPLVAHVIARLAPQVDDLAISANRHLDAYAALGHPVLADDLEDAGPLAGVVRGLECARRPLLAVVPCDCPFLPADLVARLEAALVRERADVACAAVGGRIQPVCALIARSLAPSLRVWLATGARRVDQWYAAQRLARADYPPDCPGFANLNTPDDLAAAAARVP